MKNKICLVSCEMPKEMQDYLSREYCVISLPADPLLDSPVASHPDMILSVIGRNLILPRAYFDANRELIHQVSAESGYSVILSDAPRSKRYPADVGMNVAVGKDYIICRADSTATEVFEVAKAAGKDIISVKQGYAGCSCIVTDAAVLTSDTGIHKTLIERGIESFYVDKGGISLPGYDVGFIGGCGGYYDGTLYFFGRLDSVECGRDVRRFAKMHGYEVRELSGDRLTDYGGIKILSLPLDKAQKK